MVSKRATAPTEVEPTKMFVYYICSYESSLYMYFYLTILELVKFSVFEPKLFKIYQVSLFPLWFESWKYWKLNDKFVG